MSVGVSLTYDFLQFAKLGSSEKGLFTEYFYDS